MRETKRHLYHGAPDTLKNHRAESFVEGHRQEEEMLIGQSGGCANRHVLRVCRDVERYILLCHAPANPTVMIGRLFHRIAGRIR